MQLEQISENKTDKGRANQWKHSDKGSKSESVKK